METEEQITVTDGVVRGPLQRPSNSGRAGEGSIHDDATASRLGFRGGTIVATTHLQMFEPVLLHTFGPRWLERGSLSLYFRNATTSGEGVRAFLDEPSTPGGAQVRAWVEREDEMLVADGTAAVGDVDEPSALRARELVPHEPGELRILEGLTTGHAFTPAERTLEPREDGPAQDTPAGPAAHIRLLYGPARGEIGEYTGRATGLFGALEVSNVNGPLRYGQTYTVSATVAGVGESPKTEYLWLDCAADRDGTRIAEGRVLLRWMKASSQRYA